MPKLLIFTHYFYPHQGGVEKHAYQTAQVWANQGYKVQVITTGQARDFEQFQVLNFTYPRFKFVGLLVIWLKLFLKFFWQIYQADQVLIHDVFIWYLPFRLLFPQKKVTTLLHGWEGVYPIPQKNIYLKQLAARLSWRVICVGQYLKKYYQLSEQLVDQTIYAAVTKQEVLSWQQVEAKLKTSIRPLKAVFVGRLAADTGVALLSASSSLKLEFIGDGPLKNKCEQMGQVTGFLSPDQVRVKLFSAQLCFAGGYLTALEAMAAGCLVVVFAQHQLKKDYWQLSPFQNRAIIITQPSQLAQFLRKLNMGGYQNLIKANWHWAQKQTWSQLYSL